MEDNPATSSARTHKGPHSFDGTSKTSFPALPQRRDYDPINPSTLGIRFPRIDVHERLLVEERRDGKVVVKRVQVLIEVRWRRSRYRGGS